MAKTIGILMILSVVVVAAYIQYRKYQNSRARNHLNRVNRLNDSHFRYSFRLFQHEVRLWNSEVPIYKEKVNLVCKDPSLADVFTIGIKGGEADEFCKTKRPPSGNSVAV